MCSQSAPDRRQPKTGLAGEQSWWSAAGLMLLLALGGAHLTGSLSRATLAAQVDVGSVRAEPESDVAEAPETDVVEVQDEDSAPTLPDDPLLRPRNVTQPSDNQSPDSAADQRPRLDADDDDDNDQRQRDRDEDDEDEEDEEERYRRWRAWSERRPFGPPPGAPGFDRDFEFRRDWQDRYESDDWGRPQRGRPGRLAAPQGPPREVVELLRDLQDEVRQLRREVQAMRETMARQRPQRRGGEDFDAFRGDRGPGAGPQAFEEQLRNAEQQRERAQRQLQERRELRERDIQERRELENRASEERENLEREREQREAQQREREQREAQQREREEREGQALSFLSPTIR